MAQNEFQEKVLTQFAEDLGFQEREDIDDGNLMEQESPKRDVLPSEQEVGAEQGRRYPTREQSPDTA